jgi:hypothetical protein
MKTTEIIAVMLTLVALAAFAENVPIQKGETKLIRIFDGKFKTELKITNSESLKIDAPHMTKRSDPAKGEILSYSGGAKLEVIADGGKTVLTLSAENMEIETASRYRMTPVQQKKFCQSTLHTIETVKKEWAKAKGLPDSAVPTDADLFGPKAYLRTKPGCPGGGTITLGAIGEHPVCSIPDHVY